MSPLKGRLPYEELLLLHKLVSVKDVGVGSDNTRVSRERDLWDGCGCLWWQTPRGLGDGECQTRDRQRGQCVRTHPDSPTP